MIITTEVTDADYRALQWSVLVDRAQLHWGVVTCLPLGALLFWFSAGAEPSISLALRVIASILTGVGVILLAVMAGQLACRNKPVRDGRVLLGPHTYEVREKSIVVTSEHRQMEFPVSALQSLTETPSHFFVIVRQGADLIIPRRGLESQQKEALRSFKEAVAFSSLHIDNLNAEQMTPEKVAMSFNVLRWGTLVFGVALPFTLGSELAPARAFLVAAAMGIILLSIFLAAWRTRKNFWLSFTFVVPLIMASVARVNGTSVPNVHFFQWLFLSFFIAGLPLLLFPRFFRRIARIENELKPTPQPSA